MILVSVFLLLGWLPEQGLTIQSSPLLYPLPMREEMDSYRSERNSRELNADSHARLFNFAPQVHSVLTTYL